MYFSFIHISCISLHTARLAVTLGSLYRDRFGVHYHPSLGALRAVRRVCHACEHVPCAMRYFLLSKKKNRPPAGRNCLGQTFAYFAHHIVYIFISSKTARVAAILGSLCTDRFGVHYHLRLGALRAVCRESRVRVPCVIRYFKEGKKQAAGPKCSKKVQL